MTFGRMATGFALSIVACARTSQPEQQAPAPVPVFHEPRHRVAYESRFVRVLEVRVAPGDTTLFHVHTNLHLGVVVAGARTWEQALGTAGTFHPADSSGSILDNARGTLPYTHRVGNVDASGFHYVIGQLLDPSGIAASVLAADATTHLDRETTRARLYRVALGPGQSTALHTHAQPGLIVQINPGEMELDGAELLSSGTRNTGSGAGAGAGAWWWREPGHTHVLRNMGRTPINLVEIDWK